MLLVFGKKATSVKNLLAINRKALIGLHNIAGMDFENDFLIIENTGKFTYNSIMKQFCAEWHRDFDEWNIYLIYSDTRGYADKRYRIASMVYNGFDVQRETIKRYETIHGWRWFDTLVNKGDFNTIRKNDNCHYFIVAQEKKYAKNIEKVIDFNERFRVIKEPHRTYATPLNKNCDKYYDNICGRKGFEFDKSGYVLGQNNYEGRLQAIRAERSQKQAAVYDNTEKLNEFTNRIRVINETIINIFKNNNGDISTILEIPYMKIHNVCYDINWIKIYLKKLQQNKFNDMSDINWIIEMIGKSLDKAEKELEINKEG